MIILNSLPPNVIRLTQIAIIISDVCKIKYSDALDLITETPTATALLNNFQDVLYEQVTDNVYQISKELSPKYAKLLTPKAINESYMRLM